MARVLVIEDEALLVASYERALRRGQHTVIPLHDGAQAAARARAERPDLILMDLGVPGLDPVGFIRALKEDAATSSIPIIVVSGMTMDRQALAQLAPGWIEDVWLKPVRMERLLQRANALTAPG
ncbi:MAG TPA: response regulator [Candidatus Sulfotelmatobacter sp.]|nr:response regulator [Candidatus Sulfotelmatobacter sp.]